MYHMSDKPVAHSGVFARKTALPNNTSAASHICCWFHVGQSTTGVFRISLVEPDEVEPTVFQLKGNTTTD
jgi:hypothetical protein